jgi:hypothetical protein
MSVDDDDDDVFWMTFDWNHDWKCGKSVTDYPEDRR